MAQSVERVLGKDEVSSSILLGSSSVIKALANHVCKGIFAFLYQFISLPVSVEYPTENKYHLPISRLKFLTV